MATNNHLITSKDKFRKDRPSPQRYGLQAICLMLLVLVVLFGAAGFQAIAATKTVEKGATKTSVPPAPAANDVTYPVNLFGDGKAHHFEHKTSDGTKIRYFVMKSSDGVIRAAFDACVVCWREGKGYVQDGDVMICKNCGKRFPSVKINVITGGCNPAPLTRKVENGKVIIKAESFQEGRQLFTLVRR